MAKNTKTDKTTDVTKQAEKVETAAAEVTPVTETDEEKNIREEAEKAETERLAVEKAASESKTTREQASKSTKAQGEFIVPYAKAYPKEKAFIVTSDKQVFFLKDRGLALLHQNSLNNGEKVQTIPVK